MVAAAASEAEVDLDPFFPLDPLARLPLLRPPPGVVAVLAAGFFAAGCLLLLGFLAALDFCVAAFVHAATALVRAAVLSSHLSCADGLAVGPTWFLNSSTSENRPAVETSDWRILNFDSGDWKNKYEGK